MHLILFACNCICLFACTCISMYWSTSTIYGCTFHQSIFWFVYRLSICLQICPSATASTQNTTSKTEHRAIFVERNAPQCAKSHDVCDATYACYCNLLHCCSMLFVPGFSGRRLEVEANSYRRIGEPTEAPMKRELRRTHEVFTPDMTQHDRDSVRRN